MHTLVVQGVAYNYGVIPPPALCPQVVQQEGVFIPYIVPLCCQCSMHGHIFVADASYASSVPLLFLLISCRIGPFPTIYSACTPVVCVAYSVYLPVRKFSVSSGSRR